MGNPVVKDIKHYRKTIIAKCKALRYLDDRPVFEEERRRVTAWYYITNSLTYSLTHLFIGLMHMRLVVLKQQMKQKDQKYRI